MPALRGISEREIHRLRDEELTMEHLRAHQLASTVLRAGYEPTDDGLSRDALVEAHTMIVSEMHRRHFEHHTVDRLDDTLTKMGPTVNAVHVPGTGTSG